MEKSKSCGREDQWEVNSLTIVYLEITVSQIKEVPM